MAELVGTTAELTGTTAELADAMTELAHAMTELADTMVELILTPEPVPLVVMVGADLRPVNRSFTIGRLPYLCSVVHATVGVRAPPPRPAARIPTVAWDPPEEELTRQELILG